MNPSSNGSTHDFSPCTINTVCEAFPSLGSCLEGMLYVWQPAKRAYIDFFYASTTRSWQSNHQDITDVWQRH